MQQPGGERFAGIGWLETVRIDAEQARRLEQPRGEFGDAARCLDDVPASCRQQLSRDPLEVRRANWN